MRRPSTTRGALVFMLDESTPGAPREHGRFGGTEGRIGCAAGRARSALQHACSVCGWDATLAERADGRRPPII